jgi:hypothetical protein
MAYTPATKFPGSTLNFFQWSIPSAANPRLAAPIDEDDTVLTFTSAPKDYTGTVITGNFLMNCTNASGFTELIYVPAGGMSADGLTATGCIRGVRISGLDYTTGDSSFADVHEGDSVVGCAVNAVYEAILAGVITGTIATNGLNFQIGDETNSTVTITFAGVTDKGFLRRNASTDKVQFSNDGTVWTNIDSVTASNLLTVNAADTTPGYLNDKIGTAAGSGLDKAIGTPGGNETLDLTVDTTDIIDTNYGLTEAANKAQINLKTDAGLEFTAGQLGVKAGSGITIDSGGVSLTASYSPTQTGIAGETITVGQSLAEIPYDCKWYTQLTDVVSNLGQTNALRKYAMKIVPAKSTSTLANIYFRAAEQVNGATTLGNLVVTIETDNSGSPSGTAVTNGTSTISQVTQRTWNTTLATRTAAMAGAVSLTKGTTYWVVFSCSATDAANYLKFGNASTYDENYCTFTRKTYDLDTASWGATSTTLPLFFWADVSLGSKLVPCDANFGRRTWNFVGFASAGYSADATVTYYHDIVPAATFASAISADLDYYVSETAGAISTTIPGNLYGGSTFSYKLGRGILNSSGTVDFKVNKGPKTAWGSYAPTGSATTAHQLICWFHPAEMDISCLYLSTANLADSSIGYYDGTSNYGTASRMGEGTAPVVTIETSYSAGANSQGGAVWQGVGSSSTDIGLTYTMTKSNAPADYKLLWKAKA